MIHTIRKLVSLIALAALWMSAAAAETVTPTATPSPKPVVDSQILDDGVLRVELRSLGKPESLHLKLAGSYSVEGDAGFRFQRDAEVTLFEQDGEVWLSAGGLTIDMGRSVTLTRHAAASGEENGIYLAESEKNTLYNGDLAISASNGALRAVLRIDIEEYLYGVVAYEMSDSFPIEALKAQAVAARTYAIERKYAAGTRDYDVADTTADQVFKGFDPAYANVLEAVDATRGVVGACNGGFAGCYYTASNGGQIARPSDIWGGSDDDDSIEMHDDPYDLENPRSLVNSVQFSADLSDCAALKRMLLSALNESMDGETFELLGVTAVEPADPFPEDSRMYRSLRFDLNVRVRPPVPSPSCTPEPTASAAPAAAPSPTSQALTLWMIPTPAPTPSPTPEPAWEARTVTVSLSVYDQIKDELSLGLNGGDYELISTSQTEDGFTLEMRRFGHGVGMSQRGAQWMAGTYRFTWLEILNFYYPGMTLEKIDWQTPELTELNALPVVNGYARPDPTPVPTPAPLPGLEEGESYAIVTLSSADSTLNVREFPSTSAKILDRFANGRKVIVSGLPNDEGWVQIRTAELTGYVKQQYLTP